jgi:Rrf2 family iron-sulfur cluster assembly transcriptional regulator
MIELARALQKQNIVPLGLIAQVTGLSVNYLTQLAIPLKSAGLVVGISGRNGGFQLTRPAEQIHLSEIVIALDGPISVTDCVNSPEICLSSAFCEARLIWSVLSGNMLEILESYSLADLIDRDNIKKIKDRYSYLPRFDPDNLIKDKKDTEIHGCPRAAGE